ncbi:hypothetical protein [Streptomyces megasporus]|uniref:hypothetical protein n=1 Tax=Streptomyces megasporus TaxID=44060 RepID=UPI0012FE9C2C|nr:hypothetical protein [Streptomyces megasporus]
MRSVYEYRRRPGAAWGMVVRLAAEHSVTREPPAGAVRTGQPNVWLSVPDNLAARDVRWLAHGLSLVADQLRPDARDEHAIVTVHALETPVLTDHQAEAAAAAMIEWLRENTGVPGIDHTVRFDAEENRYVFTWGEPGRPA